MPDTRVETLSIERADLSPGDQRSADFDFSPLSIHVISRADDPLLEPCYRKLWDEFSYDHSMEQKGVIISRLNWDPTRPIDRWSFLYRMIAVCKDGVPIAVRDCTAMVHRQHPQQVFVHLSHVLVDFEFRGGGLAAWMRTFPVQIARRCHAAAGHTGPMNVTLIAEMEHNDPTDPKNQRRLKSYERAGFFKVDPTVVDYYQPDFRPPPVIDAAGGPSPVPYMLIIRRVGREWEQSIKGADVRLMVEALYQMYGVHFRPGDMAVAWRTVEKYPPAEAVVKLLPPTQ